MYQIIENLNRRLAIFYTDGKIQKVLMDVGSKKLPTDGLIELPTLQVTEKEFRRLLAWRPEPVKMKLYLLKEGSSSRVIRAASVEEASEYGKEDAFTVTRLNEEGESGEVI